MRRSDDLFVESSALVAWVLWEARGKEVAAYLRATKRPWLSALAVPECFRSLSRAASLNRLDVAYVRAARRRVSALAAGCTIVPVDADILERAGEAFPVEPVRTLDAIHLASLERARAVSAKITLLSLDDRVRENAARQGIPVVP